MSSQLLAQARAYFRLAAKADRAGATAQATAYRRIAEARIAEYHRGKDSRKGMKKA